MNIREILNKIDRLNLGESTQVNELGMTPMGIGSRLATGAMAKLGSKTAAAKLDVGKRSNELNTAFRQWALRSGIDLTKVKKQELQSFFQQQRLPDMPLKKSVYNLDDKATNAALWNAVSQNAYRAGGPTGGSEPLGRAYGVSKFAAGGKKDPMAQISGMVAGLTPAQKAQLKGML